MTGYRLADNVGTAKMPYTLDSRILRVPSTSRVTPKLMLHAFAAGADGILLCESEKNSNPFPHGVPAILAHVANARDILGQAGIDPDRIQFVQFVTVMLAGFVNNLTRLSEIARKLGPIPAERLQRLSRDMDRTLFGGDHDS